MHHETDVAAVLAVFEQKAGAPEEPLRIAQELIEVLPVPVFFKGRDGRYLGVNRAWEEFFALPRSAILGGVVADLYPDAPGVAEHHQAMDRRLWERPGAQSYELPIVTRDGRARHALYYKATFSRPDGQVAGLIGTIIDITERKQAEQREAIEHAVARYLGSDEPLSQAIRGILRVMCERLGWACGARWSLDTANNRLHCAESWSAADEAIRGFLEKSAQATFTPGRKGLVREVLASGNSVWIDDVTQREDYLRASLARQAGLRGAFALPVVIGEHVLGAIEFYSREKRPRDEWLLAIAEGIGRQIGQLMARRQAEAALRESEARFRSLTELSSDWYWEQDAELRFIVMSGGVLDSLDLAPQEFLGKRRWDVEMVGVSQAQLVHHRELLARHEPFRDFEYGRRDPNGRTRWVSVSGEPVFDEHGAFAGYRGVGKDVTQRRLAREQVAEAHEALEQKARALARSNQELQQFAYVASHDLQEPLRMVSSYTQLLGRRLGGKLDGEAREFMDYIVDGAARMKQLIEDLLDYSRVGTRTREFQQVASAQALAKALVNLRAAQEASGAVVTQGEMPTVTADGAQLVQLFQNLVGNAMKFHGAEAPRIHVEGRTLDQVCVFTVKDNGIGLDPQYADRIFMMFQRLHGKGEFPGTGIGLAICKKIVERHGGRIWVESSPGAGATFGFSLVRNLGETRQ